MRTTARRFYGGLALLVLCLLVELTVARESTTAAYIAGVGSGVGTTLMLVAIWDMVREN